MPDRWREAIGQTQNDDQRYASFSACVACIPWIEECAAQGNGRERQSLAGTLVNPMCSWGLLVELNRGHVAGSEDAAAGETKRLEIPRTRSQAFALVRSSYGSGEPIAKPVPKTGGEIYLRIDAGIRRLRGYQRH